MNGAGPCANKATPDVEAAVKSKEGILRRALEKPYRPPMIVKSTRIPFWFSTVAVGCVVTVSDW